MNDVGGDLGPVAPSRKRRTRRADATVGGGAGGGSI
jgi:hypothetical protein